MDKKSLRKPLTTEERLAKKVQDRLSADDSRSLAWIHQMDLLVLQQLHSIGKKTRSQLMSMGMKLFMVQKLVKYGILEPEYDLSTNLTYYKVTDGLFQRD